MASLSTKLRVFQGVNWGAVLWCGMVAGVLFSSRAEGGVDCMKSCPNPRRLNLHRVTNTVTFAFPMYPLETGVETCVDGAVNLTSAGPNPYCFHGGWVTVQFVGVNSVVTKTACLKRMCASEVSPAGVQAFHLIFDKAPNDFPRMYPPKLKVGKFFWREKDVRPPPACDDGCPNVILVTAEDRVVRVRPGEKEELEFHLRNESGEALRHVRLQLSLLGTREAISMPISLAIRREKSVELKIQVPRETRRKFYIAVLEVTAKTRTKALVQGRAQVKLILWHHHWHHPRWRR